MLKFVLPSEGNRDDVLSFYREFEENGGECIGIGNYSDYDAWLIGMMNRHSGKNLPKGYVREDFYLCYDDSGMVGVFSLKFELTDFLLNYGGHIGYAVRPSMRGRGIATEMMRRGLEIASESGFEKVLCVCNEDNLASEKVILKNGGVLENTKYDPDEHVLVKRYWIEIRK